MFRIKPFITNIFSFVLKSYNKPNDIIHDNSDNSQSDALKKSMVDYYSSFKPIKSKDILKKPINMVVYSNLSDHYDAYIEDYDNYKLRNLN